MLYIITYDLKGKESGKDYEPLYEVIKSCSDRWWHYLESVWIIRSNNTIDECSLMIKKQLDDNDFLLIFDITDKQYQGWLPSKAWEWIKNNIHG